MTSAVKKLRVTAFSLEQGLKGEYKVADHINLTGKAIRDIGFIPINDLYLDKNNPDALKVACLKDGVEPTEKEKEFLLKHGVKAYSYELIEPSLRAAACGMQVDATVYFAQVPEGFTLEARACNIKASNSLDLAVIKSKSKCIWAGTFTQNKARAFCVEENIRSLDSKVTTMVCNSGNANACTGDAGVEADLKLRAHFSKNTKEVLVASTGKIGVTLPVDKILANIKNHAQHSIKAFAQAILTTDLTIKISQDSKANFLGFAKGSGMIHPQMATMLAFIITDKKISGLDEYETKIFIQETLSKLVDESFNSITVDGDSSTNDMCLLLNNQMGDEISRTDFENGLKQICDELAYKIVADGEGVTKVSKLTIKSDLENQSARELGRFILNSLLVKTALHGNDPNWGRIIASLGQYAAQVDLELDISKCRLKIFDTIVFENGLNTDFDRKELTLKMKKSFDIDIYLDLCGDQELVVYGNDLSNEYIRINAEYFT